MWDFMEARPYVLTNTTKEGIERVRKSKGKVTNAFLMTSLISLIISTRS